MADTAEWILKIISGPHQGVEEIIREGRVLVGVASECDIVLHDVLIAPRHLAFALHAGQLTVEAIEGRVYCAGKRVHAPTRVEPFSFVTAGTTHLVLGPLHARWPLLSTADAPELEKDPAPADVAARPAADAPAVPAAGLPADKTAPTPAQRKRAWWMVGFGGCMLIGWLVLWLVWKPNAAPVATVAPPDARERIEQIIAPFAPSGQVRIEARADHIEVSGYLATDSADRELTAALRAAAPEVTLRLWSTPRLVATARSLLADRKLPFEVTAGEGGELRIRGTATSTGAWTSARQMLLAEVPGLQRIIDEVSVPDARHDPAGPTAAPPANSQSPTGPATPSSAAALPSDGLTIVALQPLSGGQGWLRLRNGSVLFRGAHLANHTRLSSIADTQANFEQPGRVFSAGIGADLAGLLVPATPPSPPNPPRRPPAPTVPPKK